MELSLRFLDFVFFSLKIVINQRLEDANCTVNNNELLDMVTMRRLATECANLAGVEQAFRVSIKMSTSRLDDQVWSH